MVQVIFLARFSRGDCAALFSVLGERPIQNFGRI